MFGKKIENPVDDPILRPSLNSVKMTYDLAQDPEYESDDCNFSIYRKKKKSIVLLTFMKAAQI